MTFSLGRRNVGSLEKLVQAQQTIQWRQLDSALLKLFNECLVRRAIPTAWKETHLVGIPKPRKPSGDPANHRLVGSESCLLKCLTLLLHYRLMEWTETHRILPASQNGFRPGRRTADNAVILRCAVDEAKRQRQQLHVAFFDLSNAFLTVHQGALFNKLARRGARGPLMDLLQTIYDSMTYRVLWRGDPGDTQLEATHGSLAGDTASPTLWNIYMSDMCIPMG